MGWPPARLNCRTLPSYSVGLRGLCADNSCSVGLPALGDGRAPAERPAPAYTTGCWLRPAEPQAVLEVPVLDAAGRAADRLGNAASPQIKTVLRFEF